MLLTRAHTSKIVPILKELDDFGVGTKTGSVEILPLALVMPLFLENIELQQANESLGKKQETNNKKKQTQKEEITLLTSWNTFKESQTDFKLSPRKSSERAKSKKRSSQRRKQPIDFSLKFSSKLKKKSPRHSKTSSDNSNDKENKLEIEEKDTTQLLSPRKKLWESLKEEGDEDIYESSDRLLWGPKSNGNGGHNKARSVDFGGATEDVNSTLNDNTENYGQKKISRTRTIDTSYASFDSLTIQNNFPSRSQQDDDDDDDDDGNVTVIVDTDESDGENILIDNDNDTPQNFKFTVDSDNDDNTIIFDIDENVDENDDDDDDDDTIEFHIDSVDNKSKSSENNTVDSLNNDSSSTKSSKDGINFKFEFNVDEEDDEEENSDSDIPFVIESNVNSKDKVITPDSTPNSTNHVNIPPLALPTQENPNSPHSKITQANLNEDSNRTTSPQKIRTQKRASVPSVYASQMKTNTGETNKYAPRNTSVTLEEDRKPSFDSVQNVQKIFQISTDATNQTGHMSHPSLLSSNQHSIPRNNNVNISSTTQSSTTQKSVNTIIAERLVIQDKSGNERGSFGLDCNGSISIQLTDIAQKRNIRIEIVETNAPVPSNDMGIYFTVNDEKRLSQYVNTENEVEIAMFGTDFGSHCKMRVNSNSPELTLGIKDQTLINLRGTQDISELNPSNALVSLRSDPGFSGLSICDTWGGTRATFGWYDLKKLLRLDNETDLVMIQMSGKDASQDLDNFPEATISVIDNVAKFYTKDKNCAISEFPPKTEDDVSVLVNIEKGGAQLGLVIDGNLRTLGPTKTQQLLNAYGFNL